MTCSSASCLGLSRLPLASSLAGPEVIESSSNATPSELSAVPEATRPSRRYPPHLQLRPLSENSIEVAPAGPPKACHRGWVRTGRASWVGHSISMKNQGVDRRWFRHP